MGNDPDCGRWIPRNRVPTPEGEVSRRRVNRRAVAGRLSRAPAPWPTTRSSSSRRPAAAAGSRTGTTVLDAARSLGVDIDSVCGGRGICGRCQVTQGIGEFPKHGDRLASRTTCRAFAALEATYRAEKGLAADRRLSCTAQVLRRRPHRRPAREPGPSPGRAQGPRRPDFIVDPVVRLHYVEVTPPELASPTGDLGPAVRGARARVGADRISRRISRSSAASSRRSRRGSTA